MLDGWTYGQINEQGNIELLSLWTVGRLSFAMHEPKGSEKNKWISKNVAEVLQRMLLLFFSSVRTADGMKYNWHILVMLFLHLMCYLSSWSSIHDDTIVQCHDTWGCRGCKVQYTLYSIVNPRVGEIELYHDEVVQGARGGMRG